MKNYCEFFPQLKSFEWDLLEDFNIQCYPPGGGFKSVHDAADLSRDPGNPTKRFSHIGSLWNGLYSS